jgi:hypothetical protein
VTMATAAREVTADVNRARGRIQFVGAVVLFYNKAHLRTHTK